MKLTKEQLHCLVEEFLYLEKSAIIIRGDDRSGKTTLANCFREHGWEISDGDKFTENLSFWCINAVVLQAREIKILLNSDGSQDMSDVFIRCNKAKKIWSNIQEIAPQEIINVMFSDPIDGIKQHLPNLKKNRTGVEGKHLSISKVCKGVKKEFQKLGYIVVTITCRKKKGEYFYQTAAKIP